MTSHDWFVLTMHLLGLGALVAIIYFGRKWWKKRYGNKSTSGGYEFIDKGGGMFWLSHPSFTLDNPGVSITPRHDETDLERSIAAMFPQYEFMYWQLSGKVYYSCKLKE